ncbi:MAG: four-carbon acid sugar kinase family protein [Bacteroidetes bacterium]|nr:four-carbon acid sugar kinase family protein [Bacteroidota bacterium]
MADSRINGVMKKRVGVVADDITGSNDIGLMFTKGGYTAGVFPLTLLNDTSAYIQDFENLDVVIIDTDSRFDKAAAAAAKVQRAMGILESVSCDVYFNKTCSVFRGNIGAEFDAMQDALGINCSMVITGFPQNGRTTVEGIHYVNGTLLSETQFRNDPIHPMKKSSLKEIIAGQSGRKISNITVSVLDDGIAAVSDEIRRMKDQSAYIIFDIRDQHDLALVAEAVKGEKNICGSSAIAEELPKAYNDGNSLAPAAIHPDQKIKDRCGVLLIVGSLTDQTREQVSHMKETGCVTLEFHTEIIFDQENLGKEILEIAEKASVILAKGQDVLVYTSHTPAKVANTKLIGSVYGLTDVLTGKMISRSLFRIAELVKIRTHFRKLVVAGGDTSAAVAGGLNVRKMIIAREVAPGVPNMFGYAEDEELLLVLKSGSFGNKEFLQKAADSLRAIEKV